MTDFNKILEKAKEIEKKMITEYRNSSEYKNLLEALPDIQLIDIEKKND